MKNPVFLAAAWLLILFTSCRKEPASPNLSTSGFQQYTIPKGEHYATQNKMRSVEITELKFTARFDSSAIYTTVDPGNQYDINKLYGFSDNGSQHQSYSARFGWRWSDGALRLFAYTYNKGARAEKEMGVIPIGAEVACAIRVEGEVYRFTMGDKVVTMPRQSTTPAGKGYQLYPYFGGDETAPHEVRIWIRE